MFLHHPLVPQNIRQSQSDKVDVESLVQKQTLDEQNIRLLLESLHQYESYSVIRLFNLHNIALDEYRPFLNKFSSI